MIDKYSFRYKLANWLAKKLLKNETNRYFFSVKPRASCLVKMVFQYEGKVLVAKKLRTDSLAKVCLPYGYVDLEDFADNGSAFVKTAFDKMNLELDIMDFEQAELVDVKIDYDDSISQVVYVYRYNLDSREMSQISDSYSLYEFFLLDLSQINEYNKKKRFIADIDYVILKKLNKG